MFEILIVKNGVVNLESGVDNLMAAEIEDMRYNVSVVILFECRWRRSNKVRIGIDFKLIVYWNVRGVRRRIQSGYGG